jgi:exodeoxyribonuclease V alpha subunit
MTSDWLTDWTTRGWLRPLDVAFARFIAEHAGEGASPLLPLAAALLAHMEGLGHTCLPLADLAAGDLQPAQPEFADALRPALRSLDLDATAWQALLGASRVVQDDGAPLVLEHGRLYLRRHWQDERTLVHAVFARTAAALPWQGVSPESVRPLLDRLFGPPAEAVFDWQRLACAAALRGRLTVLTGGPGTGKTYTAARLIALLLATAAQPERLRIGLAAPTGKAAARLAQSIQSAWAGLAGRFGDDLPLAAWGAHLGQARTLHAWLGARPDTRRFAHDEHDPLPLDVLLVDEASMVHQSLMAALLRALPPQAVLVLLGDKDQLASVEAGAVLGDLCRGAEQGGYTPATAAALAACTGQPLPPEHVGDGGPLAQQTVMLRISRRFGGPIGRLAREVQAGEAEAALRRLHSGEPGSGLALLTASGQASLLDDAAPAPLADRLVQRALDGAIGDDGAPIPGYAAVYDLLHAGLAAGWADAEAHAAWVRTVLQAFDQTRLLAALRSGPWGVEGLNGAVQQALAARGAIRPAPGWYVGRPVMVTRNDAALNVFNGDVGMALPTFGGSAEALRVWFLDGDTLRSVLASRLAAVETAFAMTVHKSQGSEFAHTLLVLPEHDTPVLSQELVYTGITRARRALTVALPGAAVWPVAVRRRTRRASGLAVALAAH